VDRAGVIVGNATRSSLAAMLFACAFKVPLLDYNFYRDLWSRIFHPYSHQRLTAEGRRGFDFCLFNQ
jgi:hypothetical protein